MIIYKAKIFKRIIIFILLTNVFLGSEVCYSVSSGMLRPPLLLSGNRAEERDAIVEENTRISIYNETRELVTEVFGEIRDKYPITAMIISGSVLLGHESTFYNAGTTWGFRKKSDIDVVVLYDDSDIFDENKKAELEKDIKDSINKFLKEKNKENISGHEVNFHDVTKMSDFCYVYDVNKGGFNEDNMGEFLGNEFKPKVLAGDLVVTRNEEVKSLLDKIMYEVGERLKTNQDLLAAMYRNKKRIKEWQDRIDITDEDSFKKSITVEDVWQLCDMIKAVPVVVSRLTRNDIIDEFLITDFRKFVGSDAKIYKLLVEFIAGARRETTIEEVIDMVYNKIYERLRERVLEGDIVVEKLTDISQRAYYAFFNEDKTEKQGEENYIFRCRKKIDVLVREGYAIEATYILLKLMNAMCIVLEHQANEKVEEDKDITRGLFISILDKFGFCDKKSFSKKIDIADSLFEETRIMVEKNERGAQILRMPMEGFVSLNSVTRESI